MSLARPLYGLARHRATNVSILPPPHMSPTYQQQPTLQNVRIRTAQDALQVFFAVARNVLTLLTRRLDADERKAIRSGNVYIWEDRSASTVDNGGITMERWYAWRFARRGRFTSSCPSPFFSKDRRNVMGTIAHTRGTLVGLRASSTHLTCRHAGVSILLSKRPSSRASPQWRRVRSRCLHIIIFLIHTSPGK